MKKLSSPLRRVASALALLAVASLAHAATPQYTMRVPLRGLAPSVAKAPSNLSVLLTGSVRSWSDGSAAQSCKAYLTGDATHTYSGDVGSGFYQLNTSAGQTSAYCDMTVDGGGWTLAVRVGVANFDHTNPAALPITAPFQMTTGKLSDAVINALGGTTLRLNYGNTLAQDAIYSKIDAAHYWSSNSNATMQNRLMSNTLNGTYVVGSNIYTSYVGFGCYVGGTTWILPNCVNYSQPGAWGGMEWAAHGQNSLGTVWVR